ncbi:hypothetical protein N5E86_21755 [Stutzerimonas stutzeri]|uniref:hypothetical protein n=1 Tax=Stutzerimonas stutzeri TaxID=316 RepID=UPI00244A6D53|nr:hypothetical protein [Stutzerimonas stutzeri]MDH1557080.1 hypothetical protein [Stutzerimonas stutzeri]
MGNFIGYTIGLQARTNTIKRSTLVKAEFERNEDGSVSIKAVSGHTLAPIGGIAVVNISAEQWDERPRDPYNDTRQAIWALDLLGFSVVNDG